MHANASGFRVGLRHNVADLPLPRAHLRLDVTIEVAAGELDHEEPPLAVPVMCAARHRGLCPSERCRPLQRPVITPVKPIGEPDLAAGPERIAWPPIRHDIVVDLASRRDLDKLDMAGPPIADRFHPHRWAALITRLEIAVV